MAIVPSMTMVTGSGISEPRWCCVGLQFGYCRSLPSWQLGNPLLSIDWFLMTIGLWNSLPNARVGKYDSFLYCDAWLIWELICPFSLHSLAIRIHSLIHWQINSAIFRHVRTLLYQTYLPGVKVIEDFILLCGSLAGNIQGQDLIPGSITFKGEFKQVCFNLSTSFSFFGFLLNNFRFFFSFFVSHS